MLEKDFVIGSVLSTGDELFLKVAPGDWTVFGIDRVEDEEEMNETLEVCSDFIEVLVSPDPADVIESLPSGSVVTAGSDVAIRVGEDWSLSGMEGWFNSSDVLDVLGSVFEVVRRGVAD